MFGAALLAGSLFSGAGSRASAQEPAFVLYGRVSPIDGVLPARVRATVGDVVCGSADVNRQPDGTGFYALSVVSAGTKTGCGTQFALIRVRAILGEIDSGDVAALAVWRAGEVQQVDLSGTLSGSFVGALPAGPGRALLLWTGESGVPVERALATLPRAVEAAYLWDGTVSPSRSYIVGAPTEVQRFTIVDSGDAVIVDFR
ncbi:MAG: hypothetical protein DWI48_04990 [Chloroflexi bacterium]|nr:MAG: hypothetical protein DWI48_04990 [Chloroflexota bacterium]